MVLYALENVDDAYEITRAFLTGIDRTTWLKLALIVFFVGGAGGGFTGNAPVSGDGGTDPGTPPVGDFPAFDPGPNFWLLVGGIAVAVVVFVLAMLFVAAVMEFVFVESLRTETVSIREYWGRYWRRGARLFGFRLVVGLFLLATIASFGFLFFAPLIFDAGGFGASALLLLALVPVFLVLAVFVGLVGSFTTMFVVPIMILEDCGVLAGWRRLWPTVKAHWKQYLAYAVGAFVLSLVGGIAVFVATAVLVIVLLVPFGVLFAVGVGLLTVAEPVGIGWMVLTALLFALAVIVVAAVVQVPVQVYLRYYALLVLGDVADEFDVVPDQRAAVREPDEPGDADAAV